MHIFFFISMILGGDFTHFNGRGGESIYGAKFADGTTKQEQTPLRRHFIPHFVSFLLFFFVLTFVVVVTFDSQKTLL
jgi:hypothetical protein